MNIQFGLWWFKYVRDRDERRISNKDDYPNVSSHLSQVRGKWDEEEYTSVGESVQRDW